MNMPDCKGSLEIANDVDASGYAACSICGERRKVNSNGRIRKHQGSLSKTQIAAERLIVREESPEPVVEKLPARPSGPEKVVVDHPPKKEIGLILGIMETEPNDLEGAIESLKESISQIEHVNRVTLTHAKYYYNGKFYNSTEWKELTVRGTADGE